MIELGPWRETQCPSDAAHVVGCWNMAVLAHDQHETAVRVLWDGPGKDASPLAIGGIVDLGGDGMAFAWARPGLSPMLWRQILPPLAAGIWAAHERGLRRIFALVSAAHTEAVRLVKRLGFEFFCDDTGWPKTEEPALRYLHAWPSIPLPALVAHQRRELEIACLAAYRRRT